MKLQEFFQKRISLSLQILRSGVGEFPLAWLYAALAAAVLVILVHQSSEQDFWISTMSALLFGLPLALSQGILKRDGFLQGKWFAISALGLLSVTAYFGYWFDSVVKINDLPEVIVMQIASLYMASILCIPLARFRVFRYETGLADWMLFIVQTFSVSSLMAMALAGGISLTLLSLEALFDLSIHNQVYQDVWVLGGFLFGMSYWLGSLVEGWDRKLNIGVDLDVRKRLMGWVARPILTVYFLVILAYAIKIVFVGELPRGVLSWMVFGYGAIGLSTLLQLAWIEAGKRLWDKLFVFSFALPMVLFVIALSRRVSEYGWTESRLLLFLGMLLIVAGLVDTLRRGARGVVIVMLLLLAISLGFSLRFWGIPGMAFQSQMNRYEDVLRTHNLWDGTQLLPNGNSVSDTVNQQLEDLSKHILDRYGKPLFAHRLKDPRMVGLDTMSRAEIQDSLRQWMHLKLTKRNSWRGNDYYYWNAAVTASLPMNGMKECFFSDSEELLKADSTKLVGKKLLNGLEWDLRGIMDSLYQEGHHLGLSNWTTQEAIQMQSESIAFRYKLFLTRVGFTKEDSLYSVLNVDALVCRSSLKP